MALLAFTIVSAAIAYLIHRILTGGYSRPAKLQHDQTSTTKQRGDAPHIETSESLYEDYETTVDTNSNITITKPGKDSTPAIVVPQLLTPPDSRTPTPPAISPPTPPPPQMDRELMPPPPRPSTVNRLSPQIQERPSTQQSSLRVPTTAPLPNRTPSSNRPFSLQPPTSSLSANPLAQTTASRQQTLSASAAHTRSRKVVLQPGHSPLDWAALSKDPKARLNGLPLTPGGPTFLRVTPSMLTGMNGRRQKPMWTSFKGRVYNIGPYLPFHPGGAGELKRCAGRAAEKLFDEVHPWVNFEGLLAPCVVGVMVGESDEAAQGLEGLD